MVQHRVNFIQAVFQRMDGGPRSFLAHGAQLINF